MRFEELPTPCYVIDEKKIEENCRILAGVMADTGCRILLAQKAFSAFALYPLIGRYLSGTTASGLFEAKLGHEEMVLKSRALKMENHCFSPAYRQCDMLEIAEICDHIVFNSIPQFLKYRDMKVNISGTEDAEKDAGGCAELCSLRSLGLRINPEISTQKGHAEYDPCTKGSRLGVTVDKLEEFLDSEKIQGRDWHEALRGLSGFHFHTLCEQGAEPLAETLKEVEKKFGKYLYDLEWLNFGGGHHITKPGYNIALLEKCIMHVRQEYGVNVYLEPGEAVALDAGYLVTQVLDSVENGGITTLILDTSAACHMPDVIEMPYRPPLEGAGEYGKRAYSYRLSSCTCLAGDVIGDYSFDEKKLVGDRLVFDDMAIYSFVKNNTFNGIPLPALALKQADGECRIIKSFGYEDFKMRLS